MVTNRSTNLMLILADIEAKIVEAPQQAESEVLRIFSQALALNDSCAQLVATMQLARIAWHLNQFDKGIELCSRAQELLLPEFESHYLSELYHIYALQYLGLERFRSALHFWNLAMEKSLVHNQLNWQIESLIGVGNIWRMEKNLNLSYSALSLALTLSEQYDLNVLAGKSAILLSWVLHSLKQHKLMLEVLSKAEFLLQEHPDLTWHAEIKNAKSVALARLNRFAEAEAIAREVDKVCIESRGRLIEVRSPMSKATVALQQKRYNLAREYLDEAEKIALRFNHVDLLSELYWFRYELEAEQEEPQAMLFYYKKYRTFSVQLLRGRSIASGKDTCDLTLKILNYKAELLIARLEAGAFNASEGGFPAFREASIWLYVCETAKLKKNQAVFVLKFKSEKQLIAILPIVHALCQPQDLITRFKENRLALLLHLEDGQQSNMKESLQAMLGTYPWWRFYKKSPQLSVEHFSVAEFLINKDSFLDSLEECE